MFGFSEEEQLMNNIIKIIRNDFFNGAALREAKMCLDELRVATKMHGYGKCLEMREYLIGKIVDNGLSMNEENQSNLFNERRIINEIEAASVNLYEWIVGIENDIEDILTKPRDPSYPNVIYDLLEETQFLYKMILISIHEFSSLMIDDFETKGLFNKLAELRQRSINCLTTLLERYGACPRYRKYLKDDDVEDQEIEPPCLKLSEYESAMSHSDWGGNFQDLLQRFDASSKDQGSKSDTDKELYIGSYSPNVLMDKINARLNHLVKCIRGDVDLNYEDELTVVLQAISQLESGPIEIGIELHSRVNEVKVKLTTLQDLIGNRDPGSSETSLKIKGNSENTPAFDFIRESLFSETIENLHKEFLQLSMDNVSTENYFLDAILGSSEMSPLYKDQHQNCYSNYIHLNQYIGLLRSFHGLIGIMKLYVFGNLEVVLENYNDIDLAINNIKTVMMVLTTTISMLEKYFNSIDTSILKEVTPFTPAMKIEALALLEASMKKIIEYEQNQKLSELFLEEVETLLTSMEHEMQQLLSTKIWNESECKVLLHRASWLVKLWHFSCGPRRYSNLTEQFHLLIELLNSLNKEQYKYFQSIPLSKENTREYWFEILRDWQNRTELLLTSNSQIVTSGSMLEAWEHFHDRMYLVAEFQQIELNIDHYEIEFETDFLDFMYSHKSEMDRANKYFIEKLIERKEPIYRYLKFISNELKQLTQSHENSLKSVDSLEDIRKSTEMNLQILEYCQSLLDRVEESDYSRSEILDWQMGKLRTALNSTKKSIVIQIQYFTSIYEDMSSISTKLNRLEESVEAIEILLEMDMNTLLVEAFMEMFDRSQKLLDKIDQDLVEIELQLSSITSHQSKVILKSFDLIDQRRAKMKNRSSQMRLQTLNAIKLVTAIINQQKQTNPLKNNLQIYFTKVEVYFTKIDLDSITTTESAQNYLSHIEHLINEVDNNRAMIKEIEIINERILSDSSNVFALQTMFTNEIDHLKKSFSLIESLRTTKDQLINKRNVLKEIECKYKSHSMEIDKLKNLIILESENLNFKLSQDLGTIRYKIENSILYLHDIFKVMDKRQMVKCTKDFEQLEKLLDLYDDLVNEKKVKQTEHQKIITIYIDKSDQYVKELDHCKHNLSNILSDCDWNVNGKVFICQMETFLNGLIQIKNEIWNESTDIYVNNLQDSDVSQAYQDCFAMATDSIKTISAIIINFLLDKYILSCQYNDFFSELCEHWSVTVEKFIANGYDIEFDDIVTKIETIKVILECLKFVAEQSDKLTLSSSATIKTEAFRTAIVDLLSIVDKILESGAKVNSKISTYHLLRHTLSRYAEKLNIHLMLVQSLSESCSLQKHIHMKQQSMYYRAYIKHHKNQYKLFKLLCDSILDENILGFDIEDEIQISLKDSKHEIDNFIKKHSAALEEIDTSLIEWEKESHSEIVTDRFVELLEDSLEVLNDGNQADKINKQMHMEKLKLIVNDLEESELQWSTVKLRSGSSNDQEYLQQRIKITLSSVAICHMIIDYHTSHVNQSLCQYKELRWEADLLKLDLLKILNDSHCFYLETKLSLPERQSFLQQLIASVLDMESTVKIWHLRSEHVHPDLIPTYALQIDHKWENVQKWFKNCSDTLNEISQNNQEYVYIYNTIHIKLNMIGEYVEKSKMCDQFLKNVLSNYHRYNTSDLYHCLHLTEILIDQMDDVKKQLNELDHLKTQLHQLMLGQNDDPNDCDGGKITNLADIVELISRSQVAIRDKLLELLQSRPRDAVKSVLSFSCSDYEILHVDKSVSVSGDIESYNLVGSTDACRTNSTDSIENELPASSIEVTTDKCIKDLGEMFNKVMSAINDQEDFLNEKWKNESTSNLEELEIGDENNEDMVNKELLYYSTPKTSKLCDVHHWFQNSEDQYCQTINEEDEMDASNIIPTLSESSMICPKLNFTCLTDSVETTNPQVNDVILHTTENIACSNDTDRHCRTDSFSQLSADISTSSIEGINYCRFYPELVENDIRTNDSDEDRSACSKDRLTDKDLSEEGMHEKIHKVGNEICFERDFEASSESGDVIRHNVDDIKKNDSSSSLENKIHIRLVDNNESSDVNDQIKILEKHQTGNEPNIMIRERTDSNELRLAMGDYKPSHGDLTDISETDSSEIAIKIEQEINKKKEGKEEDLGNDDDRNELRTGIAAGDCNIEKDNIMGADLVFDKDARFKMSNRYKIENINRLGGDEIGFDERSAMDGITNDQINVNNENIDNEHSYESKTNFESDLAEKIGESFNDNDMTESAKCEGPLIHVRLNINNDNMEQEGTDKSLIIDTEDPESFKTDTSIEYIDDVKKDTCSGKLNEEICKTKNEKIFDNREDPANVTDPISRCSVEEIITKEGLIISNHSSLVDEGTERMKNGNIILYDSNEDIQKSDRDNEKYVLRNDKEYNEEDNKNLGIDNEQKCLTEEHINLSLRNETKEGECLSDEEVDSNIYHQIREYNTNATVQPERVVTTLMESEFFDSFKREQFTDLYSSHENSFDDDHDDIGDNVGGERDSPLQEEFPEFQTRDESTAVPDPDREGPMDGHHCNADTNESGNKVSHYDKADNGDEKDTILHDQEMVGPNIDVMEEHDLPYTYGLILSNNPSFININTGHLNSNRVEIEAKISARPLCRIDGSLDIEQSEREMSDLQNTFNMSPTPMEDNSNSEYSLKSVDLTIEYSSPERIQRRTNNHDSNNVFGLAVSQDSLDNEIYDDTICESIYIDYKNPSKGEKNEREPNDEQENSLSNSAFDNRHRNPLNTDISDSEIILSSLYITDEMDNSSSIKEACPLKPERSPQSVDMDIKFSYLTTEISREKDNIPFQDNVTTFCQSEFETYLNPQKQEAIDIQMECPLGLHLLEKTTDQATTEDINIEGEVRTRPCRQRTSLTIWPKTDGQHFRNSFSNSESPHSLCPDSIDSSLSDDTHRQPLSLPQIYANEDRQPRLLSKIDVQINRNGSMETLNTDNVTEKRFGFFSDAARKTRPAYVEERRGDGRLAQSVSKQQTMDCHEKESSEFSCWKLLLLSFLLALVFISLCLPHLPLVAYCGNPSYHILQRINPFYVKRSVPV